MRTTGHRNGILIITLLSVIATAIIATVIVSFYHTGTQNEPESILYDRYYIMITDDSKSSIWSSVFEGAYLRGLEDNIYVDWLTQRLGERYDRQEQLRIAMASGADGIIVTADESPELLEIIDEAADAGIPVVTLYGDCAQSRRCSFVGIGSYNLGKDYGRLAMEIAGGRRQDDDEPTRALVLVAANAQDLDQNVLCSGIQESLEQWEGDEQIELSIMAVDDTNAFSVEESIRDIFMENELPDIIICLDELSSTCVYQAVVDYNRVGSVSILAYYDSDAILNAIERKVIYATASPDTAQMGSYCIDALEEYNELGYTSQYFTADISIINNDNIGDYLEKKEAADE